jgi:uncharacterized delta-60 repeat protein
MLAFGNGGVAITEVPRGNGQVQSVALQPDGKIVAAGFGEMNLARYNSDGTLDITFNPEGQIPGTNYDGESIEIFNEVAIQADGKIVAAGGTNFGVDHSTFRILRFDSNGLPDPSFDQDGVVEYHVQNFTGANAFAMAIQPWDQRIVAAGKTGRDLGLIRLNPDGSLDTSFDGDGKLTTVVAASGGWANSIAILDDHKILVAGTALRSPDDADFMLARYNPDGSLDTTFGEAGIVITPFHSDLRSTTWDRAVDMALQADGKIVVVGESSDGFFHFLVARYNADGSLDTTFTGDGKFFGYESHYGNCGPAGEGIYAVAVQPDNKILTLALDGCRQIVVARFNADGSMDTTFNPGEEISGWKLIEFAIWPESSGGFEFVVQPDGKIVIGGTEVVWPDGHSNFAVVRLNTDGSLDIDPDAAGDFDNNGRIDAADIDLLCAAIQQGSAASRFDLDADSRVTQDDHRWLVKNILGTTYGDANLDGVFDSKDLVDLFASGQYEDTIPHNSGWATGDWNCDGDFTTADLVLALQEGGYVGDIEP